VQYIMSSGMMCSMMCSRLIRSRIKPPDSGNKENGNKENGNKGLSSSVFTIGMQTKR
jgi:hypothetical protein